MTETRTPVVLLPGLLCDRALWEAQIVALADVADAWVADLTRDDTLAAMAARVLAEAPFETFALAGFSMGGYVAFEVLRQSRGRVQRLALLDTSASLDTPARRIERERFIALAQRPKGFVPLTKATLPFLLPRVRLENDPALVEAIRQMTERVGARAYLNQQRAMLGRGDSEPGLARIDVPTLVLCGELDDRTPPTIHRDMAARIPGARLVVIPDCGHMAPMECPEAVSDAMHAWLAN